VFSTFTPAYRGGAGPPLVCLHGFADTWRTWQLVLPALRRRHDVLAPTLAGHAGGPPIEGPVTDRLLADAVERAMDAAGFATAHLVGNSLGGHVALQLAMRGRGRSVVALAPAGGAAHDDVFARQRALLEDMRRAAPHAPALLATPAGRRRATSEIVTRFEHIPAELLAHLMLGMAACAGGPALLDHGPRADWAIDAERIDCPVRIVWGTEDRILAWPQAAARLRAQLPHADWVELEGVGHVPQLDSPLETAELIVGFTSR
jgi:pimeloyl-ACP methyl ester carboxylesterase